tara:strand:+ start:182 stop:478 length:297 start_codon:yes stop_codon:yes gene_type:complete
MASRDEEGRGVYFEDFAAPSHAKQKYVRMIHAAPTTAQVTLYLKRGGTEDPHRMTRGDIGAAIAALGRGRRQPKPEPAPEPVGPVAEAAAHYGGERLF